MKYSFFSEEKQSIFHCADSNVEVKKKKVARLKNHGRKRNDLSASRRITRGKCA